MRRLGFFSRCLRVFFRLVVFLFCLVVCFFGSLFGGFYCGGGWGLLLMYNMNGDKNGQDEHWVV